jgi:hypothetical protein
MNTNEPHEVLSGNNYTLVIMPLREASQTVSHASGKKQSITATDRSAPLKLCCNYGSSFPSISTIEEVTDCDYQLSHPV